MTLADRTKRILEEAKYLSLSSVSPSGEPWSAVLQYAWLPQPLRFLFGSAAFWTPDYRSLFMLVFPVLWLLSGFVVPVDFFPGPLRALVDWSPLIPLLMAPVRVATGAAGMAVATQVAWVVLLWLAGHTVLALASRRLVVHGG